MVRIHDSEHQRLKESRVSYNTNTAKAEQLGMPFGTASARLKKKILLSLLQKLGEDKCYRCGNLIATVEGLSVEHKKAWFNIDTELFWDLDNIAFSHLDCNIRAGDKTRAGETLKLLNIANRKIGPPGTAYCYREKAFVDEGLFFKDRNHWNGLSNECKPCRNLRRSPKQKEDYNNYMREYMRRYRA